MKSNDNKGDLVSTIRFYFKQQFSDNDPLIIRSPGRVNLIGEHTDYNEGFVLPAAVDKYLIIGLSKSNSDRSHIFSVDFDQNFEFSVNDDKFAHSELGWPNYILGVVEQLKNNGYQLENFNCIFSGNVPIGAGMSSSAALEGGVIFGLSELFDLQVEPLDMVRFGQKAENAFVGVQCGIMDQFINIFGKENQALRLDCRSLEYEYYPFDNDDFRIVLCDSKVKHELSSSEYNVRRQQCEAGVEILQKKNPSVKSLRDANLQMLNEVKSEMESVIFNRCKYVVEENLRVEKACEALKEANFEAFGELMFASHNGLQHEYEVSCEELDILVEQAKKIDGLVGARMMGGGFGGCTINLVKKEYAESFTEQIKKYYHQVTGKDIEVYNTSIESGVTLVYQNEIH